MPYSLKSINFGKILAPCAAFLFGVWIGAGRITTVVYPDAAQEVVKTVAHVTVRNDNFELIASFPDEDVAYYRRVGVLHDVTVGSTVYTYRGDKATVTDISIHGFTIKTDYLVIGDSGTVIRNEDGEQVGYVSQQVGDNLYYCIWS